MPSPSKATSVHFHPEKLAALDAVAGAMDRDRTFIINEAIDAYLAVHRWQVEHVSRGLRQANEGDFADEGEVDAAFARWR